jgi:hypothetical protein
MANAYVQDPSEVLFYTWDFSDLLGNYTISSGSVAEATGDCSITGLTNTTTSVSAKVDTSSATVGSIYRVVCTITSSNAETFEKTITILVMEG